MSIAETVEFDKEGRPVRHSLFRSLFLALVILLTGLLGFGIGRLTAGPARGGVKIEMTNDQGLMTNTGPSPLDISHSGVKTSGDEVFASSKGTRYYYPGCRNTISEANKVTFASAAMAEAAGYTLASGCKRP